MGSLFDELCAKVDSDPRLTSKNVAKFDLTLLLFNSRHSLRDVWQAADRYLQSPDDCSREGLRAAVDQLRPIFGERRTAR